MTSAALELDGATITKWILDIGASNQITCISQGSSKKPPKTTKGIIKMTRNVRCGEVRQILEFWWLGLEGNFRK